MTERITKYMNKVSNEKRYKSFVKSSTYNIWNSPIYHAQLVYKYSQMFYKERGKKMRDTNILLDCLSKASKNLDLLESSMQTFYNQFKYIVKDKFIQEGTKIIDQERSLFSGCYEHI